jgi:glycosyltransferase involved in cell wall biosynthesis
VVVTNHNYGEFVEAAVASALAQTHPLVRVIVVDDGSTDDSRERLESVADRAELVFQENSGQAAALNAGFTRCRGDITMLLDSDDVLRPQAAERVAHAFASDPRLAKVQFRMDYVDAAGHPTGETKPSGHLAAPTGDQRSAELAFPLDIPWLPGGGTAFRADVLRRIMPIPEADFPEAGADWYLVNLAALLGDAGWIDETCVEYRVHGANAYEPAEPRLDLAKIRASIRYADATTRALAALADELGLQRPDPILSFSDIANRLVSLRLEKGLHPRPDDRIFGLVVDGFRAAGRRTDVRAPMRLLLRFWLLSAAVLPRRVVIKLGELILFPSRRSRAFNRLLGRWRRLTAEPRPEA